MYNYRHSKGGVHVVGKATQGGLGILHKKTYLHDVDNMSTSMFMITSL